MMSLNEIFYLLVIHWVCDFQLQTDKQAKSKSTNLDNLLSHTFIYSYSITLLLMLYNIYSTNFNSNVLSIISFFVITFTFHTLTDYITSKINKKLWDKGDVHNFFVSIGFDQILHYFQLFITYKLLF